MLRLITGRSGSGKTTAIYRELQERAAGDAVLFLLVPEQASYENERRLLTELGPSLSQRVQVLSFTRMADTVAREVGGMTGRRMDGTLSLLLMSQALHSVADGLSVYRRHVDSPEYLQALAGMLTECKQCAITPLLLEETARTLPEGLLRDKLTELALIFGAYDALVTQAALVDPLDDLTRLADKLPASRVFDNAYIYVDGFKGFTRQELLVLERLMPHAAELTVTLCADDITVREGREFDRFANAVRTAEQLRDASYRAHVGVAAVTKLIDNHRALSPALRVLEAGFFAAGTPSLDEPTDAVCITACADRTAECRYAARTIRRLLREEGGYCRDFTVVTRDPAGYTDLLDAAFRREGLPCFHDQREPVLTQPLITLVQSALAAIDGYNSADVLRLIKTGLLGFSTASASQLENYAFVWNVRGRQWTVPFTEHPDGLTAVADERSDGRLCYLNILRRRLAEPLARFAARLSDRCDGRQFAEAVYTLLQEWRVARSVRLRVAQLDAAGEHAPADHQARMWEYLMALLDKFAVGLCDIRLPAARFAELFRLAVSHDDLGRIPQGLDGVVIGEADRIRYAEPRTVIVLGANEGVFPAYPSGGGMLTDYERRQLIAAGLPMTDSADHQTAEERFYAYAAIASPSERLIVTYHENDGKDRAFASSLVGEIERLLPFCARNDADDTACESEEDAFATLAAHYREQTAEAAAYREVFDALPAYAGRLEAMRRLEDGFAFRDPTAARDFFGDTMRLSPSQAEAFYKCRFAYFCHYGLHIRPRKAAEIDPADAGTLAHYLMQRVLPEYVRRGVNTITREQSDADTARIITEYVDTCMGGKDTRDARFHTLIARLTKQSSHLLWRVVRELQQSGFVPADHELCVGDSADGGECVPAWVMTLPNGTTMRIVGKIDRVDTYRHDGKTYLRIVDYKTGKKTFDMANVVAGVDLQLLIYLFALCENGGARYGDIVPSGVFYLPSKLPQVKLSASAPAEEIERQQLQTMRMSGLLLDDPDVLRAMEAELEGIFIPVALDKNGEIDSKQLVSLEEFGKLKRHIQTMLEQMVTLLHAGDIAALPQVKTYAPCDYCAYHDVCGREAEDPMKEIGDIAVRDALAAMEEVAQDE